MADFSRPEPRRRIRENSEDAAFNERNSHEFRYGEAGRLETTGAELRRMLQTIAEPLADFLDSLPAQPAWTTPDAERLATAIREPLPEMPTELEPLIETLFGDLFRQGFNTASPGYLAFIPGGGLPVAAVADLIAGIINRYPSVWQACPAAAETEATVLRWICDMVGYPESSGGYLTTGGSLANWSAVVTARRCRLPDDFLNGTIYISDQTHHSIAKAAMLAGFPERNVRSIASDERFRIRVDALEEAIAADRREGFAPFLIVGNAGTVHTGAVDDFEQLADVAEREHLWLHADAAYGGFFMLTERGRSTLAGLNRADSISLDPHKGLFLPFGTGTLLVKRLADLEAAHRLDADYLPAMQEDPARIDFCRISPELSREFRGLRLWLPLKLFGVDAFREALHEKLDLAGWAASELRKIPNIEIVADPQLSLVAFRLKPAGGVDPERENARNRAFLERINAGGRSEVGGQKPGVGSQRSEVGDQRSEAGDQESDVGDTTHHSPTHHSPFFITGTIVRGAFVLRICVLSFRTHQDRVQLCIDAIREAAAEFEGIQVS